MPQRNLREQLIEGASGVLLEKGFHAASVNDIVSAAGVPKGSFYNHFESKDALALEVVKRYAAGYDDDALFNGDGAPLDRLRTYFERIIARTVARGIENGCLLGTFSSELPGRSPDVEAFVAASLAGWSAGVADVLEQAQAAGDLDSNLDATVLGIAIVDAFEGAVARAKVSKDRAAFDAFLATAFDVLLAR